MTPIITYTCTVLLYWFIIGLIKNGGNIFAHMHVVLHVLTHVALEHLP